MLHTQSLIRVEKLYHQEKTFLYGDLLKVLCAYSLNFAHYRHYLLGNGSLNIRFLFRKSLLHYLKTIYGIFPKPPFLANVLNPFLGIGYSQLWNPTLILVSSDSKVLVPPTIYWNFWSSQSQSGIKWNPWGWSQYICRGRAQCEFYRKRVPLK